MKRESNTSRWPFSKPSAAARLPIYLDRDVESCLAAKARSQGIELVDLVNGLLKKEIEILDGVN